MAKVTPLHRIRRRIRTRNSSYHPQNINYKWWVLANIMLGTFMAVLDATIVNVGIPKIMSSFGVGLDSIEWVITGYMLALAVMLPTSAWLADRFGYKRMYFIGLFVFTFGSFLCGISVNENMLIISRIIQGLGGGAIQPLGMAIISREFPPKQRGMALGFWAIAAAASVSFGPMIGGYLVDNFSWQWIFNVNLPIGVLGLIATVLIQREYVNKKARRFDVAGFISIVIFLPLTLFALSKGNAATNSQGWSAPYILLCFAIALIALAVFITAELTVKEPLIDLRLLQNRNFGLCVLIILIFGMGMFGSTFLLPLYLQNSLGYTALQAGSVFLPVGIIQGILSPVSGRMADRINGKIPVVVGIILFAISFYLNSFLSYLTEHDFIMLPLYLRGLGMGMLFTPLNSMGLAKLPREKMAQASGLLNTTRQLGGSLGVALFATLLTARVSFHSQVYNESVQSRSPEFSNVDQNLKNEIRHFAGSSNADAAKQSRVAIVSFVNKQAFIQGVDDDFLLASGLTLLGLIPVFFLKADKKKNSVKPLKT